MLSILTGAPAPRAAGRRDAAERDGRWARLRAAYAEWRFERDIRGIERALARLSDRQLALIGLSRDTIARDVAGMIEQKEIARSEAEALRRLVDHPQASEPNQQPPSVPTLSRAA